MAASQHPGEVLYKILMIGDPSVGKTCIIRQYVHGVFQPTNKATIGVDFALKVLNHQGRNTTLQIWDIAGQERYGHMTHVYFKGAVGAVCVVDITRPDTYESAIKWKADLDSKVFLPGTSATVPTVLLLNKRDLAAPHMTAEQIDAFCLRHGFISWFEVSAKDNTKIAESFQCLFERVVQALEPGGAGRVPAPPMPTAKPVDMSRPAKRPDQPADKKPCPC